VEEGGNNSLSREEHELYPNIHPLCY